MVTYTVPHLDIWNRECLIVTIQLRLGNLKKTYLGDPSALQTSAIVSYGNLVNPVKSICEEQVIKSVNQNINL